MGTSCPRGIRSYARAPAAAPRPARGRPDVHGSRDLRPARTSDRLARRDHGHFARIGRAREARARDHGDLRSLERPSSRRRCTRHREGARSSGRASQARLRGSRRRLMDDVPTAKQLEEILGTDVPTWPDDTWLDSASGRLATIDLAHEIISRPDDAAVAGAVKLILLAERE